MGTRVQRNKQKRDKQNSTIKIIILFLFLGVLTVVGSASLAVNVLNGNITAKVQELAKNKDNNYNSSVIKEEYNNDDSKHTNKQSQTNSDDVAYLEKYLGQQVLGQMPDDADGKKIVYLTFDDGPSTTVTPYILNILKRENVKATFFVVGKSVDLNEESKKILKREYDEGHAIGNHTYTHDYDYLYPNRQISIKNFILDINKTNDSLKNILGSDFSTRVIRFPGGYMSWNDQEYVGKYLNDVGYYYIDWNSLSKDSEGEYKTADELVDEVKRSVYGREKAVILMHDNYGKEETAKALPEIIDYLKNQGYEFRTIR